MNVVLIHLGYQRSGNAFCDNGADLDRLRVERDTSDLRDHGYGRSPREEVDMYSPLYVSDKLAWLTINQAWSSSKPKLPSHQVQGEHIKSELYQV